MRWRRRTQEVDDDDDNDDDDDDDDDDEGSNNDAKSGLCSGRCSFVCLVRVDPWCASVV